MLSKLDSKNELFPVKKVSYESFYQLAKSKLSDKNFKKVWDFIENDISEEEKFSCTTKYNLKNREVWGQGVFRCLYLALEKDTKATGYFLGLIVQDVIINSDDQWYCIKTNITNRDFATMFYWRKD